MFKLFGGESEDKKIHDQKILIDLASNTLNHSLNLYYNNCVSKKKSKNLFEGNEYFYLFLIIFLIWLSNFFNSLLGSLNQSVDQIL